MVKRSTTEADAQQLTGPVHTDHDLIMTICTGHMRIGTFFITVLKADLVPMWRGACCC